MPGARGVRFLIFSLLVISVLFFPAISADETAGSSDLAIVPGPVDESCTLSMNRSVTVATILPTPVPLVPETLSPVEAFLPEPAPAIPAPAETLAHPPATTGAIIQPTVTSTLCPEVALLAAAYATTAPVPSEPRTITVTTTGQIPAPHRTLVSSRQETPASLDNTSHTTLRPQKGATGKAPVNPAFLLYQNHTERSAAKESRARESTTIVFNDGTTSQVVLEGEIPSPIDFTYTRELAVSPAAVSLDGGYSFPTSFDLRSSGKVSPVKNQGRAGSCWAFAAFASLESSLLPGETWDFSENNLKNTLAGAYMDGFDRDWSDGGNREMSTAYLTRWSGPVRESEDPYSDISGLSPAGLHSSKHVQDVYFLPMRSGSLDNTYIKEALMTRGAVQTSIYWSDSYYNAAAAAFYNNRTSSTNHAITLVGWDDTYSRTNFMTPPIGDGAFIAKNSWGSVWGAGGYFYVSYYDLTIGDRSAVFTSEPVSNYDRVYSYDPLGWVGSYGFSSPSARYANVFTARSVESLTAIGVYTTSPGTFTARIYLDPAGGPINTSGHVAETSWSNSLLGYQTVDIPDVDLKPGQQYSIVVLATTTGYGYPVPLEYPIPGYSSHATARAGESFISSTGTTWTDVTTIVANTSVCVKGYTVIKSRIGISRDDSWNLDNDGSFAWNTGDNYYTLWGTGALPVVGDWNGDDITEIGAFTSGSWFLDYNGNGVNDGDGVDKVFSFGSPGYQPVVGDWNGDGKDEIGVELDGFWTIDYNGNYVWDGQPVDRFVGFGQPDDNPVIGDWNGDGKDEIGSEKDGFWSIDYNGNYVWDGQPADRFAGFGQANDNPVIGDWNGDGKDEIGSEKDGFWSIDYNGNYVWDSQPVDRFAGFGQANDNPVVGDWDGDRNDEIASFKDGFWSIDYNGNYVWDGQPVDKFSGFGSTDATPVAGAWS